MINRTRMHTGLGDFRRFENLKNIQNVFLHCFYKSNKTGRWWMEINLIKDNKYKRHALVPCTYQDYTETTKEQIPDRWFKAQRKML